MRSSQHFAWLALFLATSAVAQSPEGQGDSPRQQVMRSFDRSAPQIGQRLPDIQAFDADGNPFQLQSLEGHYSVLVFGCLT